MKKFFTAICVAALLMTGCVDDSAEHHHLHNSAQASPVAQVVPNFTTKTITGATVTNEIFASKKITMINIWGTFCPPCIGEMPELGEMARNLPADAQIIGLVCNADENSYNQIEEALRITQESGANFVNLLLNDELAKFIENVEAVPTTIFVNSKGEVVGNAIIGADVDGYKDELEKLLAQ